MLRLRTLFFAILFALLFGDNNYTAAQTGTPVGWTQTLTTASYSEISMVSMDVGGNVYVAGSTSGIVFGVGPTDNYKTYAAKYSRDGALLWNHVWTDSAIRAITPDSAGNAFAITDNELQKFDSTGTLLWSSSLNLDNGLAGAAAITTDNSGNLYVTGADASTLQPFVAKLNSAGTFSWTTTLDAPLPRQCAIAVNSSGTVMVANSSCGPTDSVAQLVKLNSSGTKTWSANYGQSSGYTFFGGVAIDETENMFLTINSNSHLFSDSTNGMDNYLVKYTPANNMLWHRNISNASWSSSLAIDPAGYEYAVSQYGPIQKFNTDGTLVDSLPLPWDNVYSTSIAFGGGNLSAVNCTDFNGDLSTILSGKIGVVPEPSAFLLLGTSFFSLLAFAWRRRRS
jgi:hypothetical protein